MTRFYDYDEFIAARRATVAGRMAALAESRTSPRRRGRPRSAEEREAIIRAAVAHMRQRRESGELVEIAPRLYVLK